MRGMGYMTYRGDEDAEDAEVAGLWLKKKEEEGL